MNTMQYLGYAARIDFDAEDRIFVGQRACINDSGGAHADTVEGLEAAFQETVDDYVETCGKLGKAGAGLLR